MKSWAPPTGEELDRVAVLCARPENRAYFFDRLENPSWVGPLAERGFFANPPSAVPAEEPGYVRFPPWPEGRYLVRVAAEAPAAVGAVLADIGLNDNPAVTGLLFKILANLPDDRLRGLTARAQEWVSAPFADKFADESASVALRLLASGATAEALALVDRLLQVLPDPRLAEMTRAGQSHLRPSPEATARLSDWEYERVLARLVAPMVDTAGLGAVRLLVGLLDEALRLTGWEGESAADELSYMWRPAVEEHEQNSDSSIKNTLVSAVRDAAIRLVERDPALLDETIQNLESGPILLWRIALHVLALTRDGAHLTAARILDRTLFDDRRLRREYAALLRAHFGELDAARRSEVLSWIDDGPDLQMYRQRKTGVDGRSPTEAEVRLYADHWRRDRYSFIERYLDENAAARYRDLVERTGSPEHADTLSWSTSWVGPESPATMEELSQRSTVDVIDYLHRWRPDDAQTRFGPSIEGLGRVFAEIVAARASDFAGVAAELADSEPTYVRGFFTGLEKASREGATFAWDGPLALATEVVGNSFEPDIDIPDRDEDPGWTWTRRQIGSLLRSALADTPNRMPFAMRAAAWRVIDRLTSDPNPSPEHEARYGGDNMDPLTLSINTTRGTAMHAVIEYALWCRRELESLGTDVSRGFELMPEVAEVLDRHLDPQIDTSLAVRAVYGQWLPWLLLLDEAWTIRRLPLIFPSGLDDRVLSETAWDTYITWCPPYDSALRVLSERYREEIDRVPSGRTAGSFGHDTVDSKLGQHLVTYYWRGLIDRELLEHFFRRAGDELAADVTRFVGRALRSTTEELSESICRRIQDLGEWRLSETAMHPQVHTAELRAFGSWFASGKLDDEWSLRALERSVDLVGAPTLGHLVVERLVDVSTREPARAVNVLARMLERPEHEWDFVGWRDEARAVVDAALATNAPEAAAPAAEVIDFYVSRGELDFRELTSQSD
jgi:hypothetical protein